MRIHSRAVHVSTSAAAASQCAAVGDSRTHSAESANSAANTTSRYWASAHRPTTSTNADASGRVPAPSETMEPSATR